jgi:hypothetical protein
VCFTGIRRLAVFSVFGAWLILATVAASTLTAWHSIAVPVSTNSAGLTKGGSTGWRITHYLSSECGCSQGVASYLESRGPLSQATEEVVLIASTDRGRDAAFRGRLSEKNFRVELISENDASTDGVQGVPTLEIVAPTGRVAFRGGYRKLGAAPGAYLDVAILSGLMASRPVGAIPIYGCATSTRLRRLLDPLGLK